MLHVAFVHPDLGLGGAERLVVDAAAELANLGHDVDIYTAHYDPNRCFKETTEGHFHVKTFADWFPRHIAGRCHALCAYIRCILVALYLAWTARRTGYDVIFVDQVSAVIPFLQWFTSSKVLFYCHFPDLLLAQCTSALHAFYRRPIDWLEQTTTGMADSIVVNSAFTQGVFSQTFKRLDAAGIVPEVLHPGVILPSEEELQRYRASWRGRLPEEVSRLATDYGHVFVSVNRFERKKGIGLAIQALSEVRSTLGDGSGVRCALVVAGGYDERLSENCEYYKELQELVASLGLQKQVVFMRSFTDTQKCLLLALCTAVLYTPENEHFGIVPLEAMAHGRPVVACNSGGPTESVDQGHSGFLCEPTPQQFSNAMRQLLDDDVAERMGRAAREHVMEKFSRTAFGVKLQGLMFRMLEESHNDH